LCQRAWLCDDIKPGVILWRRDGVIVNIVAVLARSLIIFIVVPLIGGKRQRRSCVRLRLASSGDEQLWCG